MNVFEFKQWLDLYGHDHLKEILDELTEWTKDVVESVDQKEEVVK